MSLGKKNNFQIKAPYMFTNAGHVWKVSGISDISISYTRNLLNKGSYQVNRTIGTKIPTRDSNKKIKSGETLPMYSQISLGTYDFIAGMSLISK